MPGVSKSLTRAGALARISPAQREVIHLHVFEGLTFQAIADGLGESINTVAARYRYGLEKLRVLMSASGA